MTATAEAAELPPRRGDLAAMALGALGVVYGDIGTRPLYTLKTAIEWAGGEATPAAALGMLSLIVWTLIITTSIKYVAIVMRADNDGEGGILALMSLLGIKHGERAGVIAIGILGGPALRRRCHHAGISVLSALEGIKVPLPTFVPYVLPALTDDSGMSALAPLLEGLCCKSRFALVIKNSAGCRRDFRVRA
jgi:KUP system potassium uptake protein